MKKVVTYTSRLTIALGISLILAIVLAAGFSIWMLRLQEISKWEKQTETFAVVLAENTNQQMEFAYTALNSITERIEDRWSISAEFLSTTLANADFHQFLKDKIGLSPAIDVISVLDANGDVISTSRSFPAPTYNLADRDYFIVQRDNPTQGIYLSSAVRNKSTGRWSFFLSQRLTGSDGEFIGIVMLGLSPVFYSQFYEKLHIGEHASIALMRNDFTYLARWPEHADVVGKKNLTGSTYQVIHDQKKKAGVLIGTQPRMSYDDKVVTRLAAVQSLDKYPLIINFSVDEELYLADWRKISTGIIIIALFCIVAVMAGFTVLVVLLRSREADMKITTELKQKAEVINHNQAGLLLSLTEKQKALTESSERLEAIFQNAPDGIVMIDDQGLIEALNPAAVAIYGYAPEEVIGQHGQNFSPPGQEDLLRLAMQQEEFLRTGRLHIEAERMRKGGSMFPAELSISEYFLLGKRKLIVIVRDISERRKIEKMKSEFISTVSHELRTPLTAIRGALGLVVGGAMGTLADKMAPLLTIAYKNSESLTRLINDLLDIQKIEAGKMEFVYETVSVQALLQTSVSNNQTLAHSLGVHIIFNSTDSDVMIQVDTGRFQQVMANLLSNACKYSPAGGEVRIVCQRPDEQRIRIEVVDRGSGVPEGFRSHLFEKFSQADASDTRAKGGTGLGLAISQAIVAQMRGDINYYMDHDSIGQSTHFYVEFPVVSPQPARV